MKSLRLFILLFLVTCYSSHLTAQSEVFTANHMWQMKRVTALDVSPDGKKAVFALTVYDIDEDKGTTDLYLLDIPAGDQRRLTFTGRESSPVFSPDGKRSAFISRRHDGPGQVYILPLVGGLKGT